MNSQAQAVAEPVAEIRAITGLFQHFSGQSVSLRCGHPRFKPGQGPFLGLQDQAVNPLLLRAGLFPHHHRAGKITAVPRINRTAVHHHQIPGHKTRLPAAPCGMALRGPEATSVGKEAADAPSSLWKNSKRAASSSSRRPGLISGNKRSQARSVMATALAIKSTSAGDFTARRRPGKPSLGTSRPAPPARPRTGNPSPPGGRIQSPSGPGAAPVQQKLGNTLPELLSLFLQVNTGPGCFRRRLFQVAEIGQKNRPFLRYQENPGTPGETTQIAAVLRGDDNKPVQFFCGQ